MTLGESLHHAILQAAKSGVGSQKIGGRGRNRTHEYQGNNTIVTHNQAF